MPLQATSGAASYDGFGGGVPFTPTYIEDVFSTWLYTGTGSAQTITNGIDLAGKGGMVWTKARSSAISNGVMDTARGTLKTLITNNTDAEDTYQTVTAFNANGFSVGTSGIANGTGSTTMCSWTFRKQPKFFDVVTWTGDDVAGRQISHSLGSVPGCILVKSLNAAVSWQVYHRSLGATNFLNLNNTNASQPSISPWNNTAPTSTNFTVGDSGGTNAAGVTYVAYIFAHDAGGFGLTGTDNVISCGSFTALSNSATVTLGYEPQWILWKRSDSAGNWYIYDTMRGWSYTVTNGLYPNTSGAEVDDGGTSTVYFVPTATGFGIKNFVNDGPYIYIAIRRGPMKTPTSGTSVYENTAYTGNGASNRQIGSSVLTDLLLLDNRDATAQSWSTYAQMFFDRLRGDSVSLATANTNAESGGWNSYIDFDMNAGWDTGPTTQQTYLNKTSSTYVSHAFRRAPGFFDVVCYTGNGVNRTVNHNLGVVPELILVKKRNASNDWTVYSSITGNGGALVLNGTNSTITTSCWNNTTPTASVFSLAGTSGGNQNVNDSGDTYVAYLAASLTGVSKIGTYTGNGSTQTIDCGFTAGARFVLIKAYTEFPPAAGNGWFVFDTARGMTTSADPFLRLNLTNAETSTSGACTTTSGGFAVDNSKFDGINSLTSQTGGVVQYLYWAIA